MRLIPARAGNIIRALSLRAYTTAHPRSRGEHRPIIERSAAPSGSSPLARGTYNGANSKWAKFRLIPARAGNMVV